MLKQPITYTDFNGTERTEFFYFNLTQAELTRQLVMSMKLDDQGNVVGETLEDSLKKIIASNEGAQILPEFEKIVSSAYGEKSEDGRFFRKSPQIAEDFVNSAAYQELFMMFMRDADFAAHFINSLSEAGGGSAPTQSASDLARARSEAQLQGFKKPTEPNLPTVDENNQPLFKEPAPTLSDAERAELEELRRLKEAQAPAEANHTPESFTQRPPHESGPGFQQA
jgi:hypothetical protein